MCKEGLPAKPFNIVERWADTIDSINFMIFTKAVEIAILTSNRNNEDTHFTRVRERVEDSEREIEILNDELREFRNNTAARLNKVNLLAGEVKSLLKLITDIQLIPKKKEL